ncbi:hypothetical protein ABTM33_19280, partial [Acinetobacter baumannii]
KLLVGFKSVFNLMFISLSIFFSIARLFPDLLLQDKTNKPVNAKSTTIDLPVFTTSVNLHLLP